MGRQVPLAAVVGAVFAAWAGCDAKEDDSAAEGTDTGTEETVADDTGTTTPVDPLTTDDDLDGWTENDGDCNDHNDAVYPGARERSYDGVDSNCDGDDVPDYGEDRYAEALPLLDTDGDGAISLEEFEAGCAESAMLFGTANPGVVETHLTCGGTTSCRGMILHTWNELLEHDCRGVNGCAGWSCVETATGNGWDGLTTFEDGQCSWCHGGEGTFLVHVPEGEDPAAWLEAFPTRSDAQFLSTIAFGASGVGADGVAWSNMPGHYDRLSRAEMEAVIAYLRTLDLQLAE